TNIEETDSIGVLYGTQDWGSQLRKERVSGDVSSPSTYRLQKEFCDLIEWAFGSEGIRSLRTIAAGIRIGILKEGFKVLVVWTRRRTRKQVLSPSNLETYTVIGTGSAAGDTTPPWLIFETFPTLD
ncbi:hypothetical protein BHE90_017098, partial [Fusarium euwallaceae]